MKKPPYTTSKLKLFTDLKRLCHYGDCLGLSLMHPHGSFVTLVAHVQTNVFFVVFFFFDDLERAVSV